MKALLLLAVVSSFAVLAQVSASAAILYDGPALIVGTWRYDLRHDDGREISDAGVFDGIGSLHLSTRDPFPGIYSSLRFDIETSDARIVASFFDDPFGELPPHVGGFRLILDGLPEPLLELGGIAWGSLRQPTGGLTTLFGADLTEFRFPVLANGPPNWGWTGVVSVDGVASAVPETEVGGLMAAVVAIAAVYAARRRARRP